MNRQAAHRRYMRAVQAHELGYRRRPWSEIALVAGAYGVVLVVGLATWAALFLAAKWVGAAFGQWINGGEGW